jgi:peptidoglycan/LPS O-acetylase OafA/YrhL
VRPVAPAPFNIPSLDGVRALSIVIVFVAHAGLEGIVPAHFGLTLFFFLSGYLITTLLRMEYDKTGDVSLKQFYLRRVLRIFPPFYLVLFVATMLTALGAFKEGSIEATALTYQSLHLTNYYMIGHGWWQGMAPGTWVYWSLAIEEHFYLGFPLFYLWLRRKMPSGSRQAFVLLSICALVLAWRCVLVFGLEAPKDRTYLATDTRIDAILAGCILAVWANPVLDRAPINERMLKFVWLPLGLAAVVASLIPRAPSFEQTFRYTLQSFGLFPFFIAAVRWHDRGLFRLLNLRPVRYLGLLSYSLYLMHMFGLWAAGQWTNMPLLLNGVVVFAVLTVLAVLIHRFIEKPCAGLRRRLSAIRT